MEATFTPRPVRATAVDTEAWMAFVDTVKESFPWLEPPDTYRCHLAEHISRREAWCVKDGERVIGVMLCSIEDNRILCLAVSPDYRRCGLATQLLQTAVESLDAARPVTVRTFRADDPRGMAPRALYTRF